MSKTKKTGNFPHCLKFWQKLSLRTRFSLFFLIFVLAVFSVVIFSSIQQYNDAATITAERLGYPIIKRAAAFIDGDAFEKLCETLDPLDPFYEEMRLKLYALKEETQCLYIYTMAMYQGGVHRFIIDGGNPGEEGFSPLGAIENIKDYSESYLLTYETKEPQAGEMDLQSSWGWVISAYMPIFNSKGKMVGVIGCDFEAESMYRAIFLRISQQIAFAALFIFVGFIFYLTLLHAVTRQNDELRDINKKMKIATESKSRFLAHMSHEIRTPMNAIIGMSELAEREYGSKDGEKYIEEIKAAGKNLLSIINDILDFSKIETGSLELNETSYEMGSLLNDVLNIIRVYMVDKPIELYVDISPDIPVSLTGDETRVRQILLNVLSNACKYTHEGFIKLKASCERMGKDLVKLTFIMEDSGIGIKSKDIDKLFGDFVRVDEKRNIGIEGTGLGLAITRSLCLSMDGNITVKSQYGKGSVFTVTIMQKCSDFTGLGEFSKKSYTLTKNTTVRFIAPSAHLLIVDDNMTNLKVALGLLLPYKSQIDTCLSGKESIRLARETAYDIIFMDHMMPEMDGILAAAEIRKINGDYFKKVPIIALTANAVVGMKEMFLRNGFSDYLAKPIEINKLNEMMEKWIPLEKKEKKEPHEVVAKEKTRTPNFFIKGLDTMRGLDTVCGVTMTGGSEARYLEILELFVKDADMRLKILKEMPDEKTLRQFVTQVHAIKSASASIGAFEISKLTAELEDAGIKGDLEFIQINLASFLEKLIKLTSGIKSAISGRPRVTTPTENFTDLGLSLNLLEDVLQKENIRNIDKILADLGNVSLDDETRDSLSKITDLVLLGEFKKASLAVKSLKEKLKVDKRKNGDFFNAI